MFLPDSEIFEETVYDYDILKQRLREMAFLTKGSEDCSHVIPEKEWKERKHSTMKVVSVNL